MQFLTSAAEQGNIQAELGEIAVTHAQSPDVIAFGRSLAKENAVQSEQIKLLAINKGLALPENLNPKKDPAADRLQKLKGLKFDKAYVAEMLAQLQNYVSIFEAGAQSHDADIKAFAESVLPVIKQHLAFLNHTVGGGDSVAPRFRTNGGSDAKPLEPVGE